MWQTLLFPKPKRDFPYQRWVRISVRTWHLLSMGILLGGTAHGLALSDQPLGLWMTFGSGLVFVALELYGSCVWLLQLKGWAVIAKLLLLGAAVASTGTSLPYLIAAVVIGGISSHMPGKYRYFSPFHGRVVKE
ncbi:MAG TPA: hypothetical protein VKB51_08385 [bacterium]|nr:hypothetical protein [bacterium]